MTKLVLGVVLFFGMHSISVIAPSLRDRLVAQNEKLWKTFYSIVSLLGFVLIVLGYAEARHDPAVLYVTPAWLYPVASIMVLPAFILFFAPYFPGWIKNKVGHPQLAAVLLWALAHLLVNGMLADVLLFGSFFVWAAVVWLSFRWRAPRPVAGAPPSKANDLILVVLGLALYALFALWLHARWLGVDPMSRL